MPRKSHSKEFKYEVLLAYKNHEYTIHEICSKYQISDYSLYQWIHQFERTINIPETLFEEA